MIGLVKIIKKDQYKTTHWSGGTTTELLIYPSSSTYIERNFKWRISSASVDTEISTFTNLPGISRHIMLLDGTITLEHEGKYTIKLKPFEQDSFMGHWTTKSFGNARDFNLMLAEGYTGNLEALTLKVGENLPIILSNRINVFYVVNGSLELTCNDTNFIINENDLFYGKDCSVSLFNNSKEQMKIIKVEIGQRDVSHGSLE